jgi:hypothetical protein
MSLSNNTANNMLNSVFYNHPTWVALHTADPGVLGDPAYEVSGGDYVRQPIVFTNAGSRTTGNSGQATFHGMPDVVVTHISVWNAVTVGQMLAVKDLAAPVTVAEGYSFVIPAVSLAITL